ncbi:MAG: ABC transporter permease [Deltaproteobacteria bacterium]|nr:ABC transporter permease [Deltaproteobacteria bacterium]
MESARAQPGARPEPKPDQPMEMITALRELIKCKDLLYMITLREIKVKYVQSMMGFLWAILMPMLVISAGILVRVVMAHLSNTRVGLSEIASVSVKSLPWSFFVASIRFATNSLVADTNLVTKIYFPREILPLSSVLSQLVDFAVASVVLTVFLIVAGVGVNVYLFWVPYLLVIMFIFCTALGLLLAATNLFFRDVKYIVEVFLTFAIFFTPVFYDAKIAGRWEWLLLINPMAPILENLSWIVVYGQPPDYFWMTYSSLMAVGGLVVAVHVFKKLEPKFAESV